MAKQDSNTAAIDGQHHVRIPVAVLRPRVLPSRGTKERALSDRRPARDESVEIDVEEGELRRLVDDHKASLTVVYETLDHLTSDLKEHAPKFPVVMPRRVRGRLLQPDGV